MTELVLGFNALKNLLSIDSSDEFTFLVNGECVTTTRNKACAISSKICYILRTDPTMCQYSINFPVPEGESSKELFAQFMKSISAPISIEEKQIPVFQSISLQLQTDDILSLIPLRIKDVNTAITMLQYDSSNSESLEYLAHNITDFLASEKAQKMDIDILRTVLMMFFEEENNWKEAKSVFEIIAKFDDSVFLPLVYVLPFNFLSHKEMITFISRLNESDSFYFPEILECLKLYFSQEFVDPSPPRSESMSEIIENDTMFNGIFSYIKRVSGSNPALNGAVKLTNMGSHSPTDPISNILEYDEDTLNGSFFNDYQRKPSAEHNWIEFDFIDKKVALTGYSIRSSGGPADNEHAASWKIIASNDQETWVTIDEKQRNEDLNGRYAAQKFLIDSPSEFYRYIRYIQLDSHWQDHPYNIFLTAFEFFGSITINT